MLECMEAAFFRHFSYIITTIHLVFVITHKYSLMNCVGKRFCESKVVSLLCRPALFCAIISFLTLKRIFKYLKKRLPVNEIEHLNKVVKTRYKLNAVAWNVQHLKECLKNDVARVNIQRRVVKTKAFHTLRIEKYLVRDELARARNEHDCLKVTFHRLYSVARGFLSIFDFVRFSALLSKSDRRQRCSLLLKYEAAIDRLRHHRFGKLTFNHDFIINLSSVTLSTIQKDVLSKGTDFCIPWKLKKEQTLAEFELLYQPLCNRRSVSEESLVNCGTELQYLSTKALSLKPDHSYFLLSK